MVKKDIKRERFKEFLAEAEDVLNSMGKGLLRLGKGVKAGVIDPSVINSVFRSAHTLKGISGVFEVREVTDLCHALEDTLDMLRLGRISLTDEVLASVMDAHDLLTRIVASRGRLTFAREAGALIGLLGRSRQGRPSGEKADLGKEIHTALTDYEEHRLRENLREQKNIIMVDARFPITSFDKNYLSLTERLKTESEVIATLPSPKTSPDILSFDILIGTSRDERFISALVSDITQIEVRAISLPSSGPGARGETAGPRAPQEPQLQETFRKVSNTVRVNINKLDNIMNIISELGMLKTSIERLAAGMLQKRETASYGVDLARMGRNLERKFGDLRDSVLDVRMVPIGNLFGRFETFVERLSRESGKEIRLSTAGDDTELDKLIVEELADPVMHIIRNAVDHAIEPPHDREAAGKPRAGTITLSACQKGNHVIVEIGDDGSGIDAELVKRKAVERGLVGRDYVRGLSREDVLGLIMLPGFTTRDAVTSTSGRGVGMDVVKENITRLSGIIDITTEKGKGTRFVLTIPVTLAIIEALIVEELGERYAVPLNSVVEIIEFGEEALNEARTSGAVKVNGRVIPSVRLSAFFRKNGHVHNAVSYGIIAGLAEKRVCVLVNRLIEELDVVIKPLPRQLKPPGIAGATDMGEKGVFLVLDLTGMLESIVRERHLARGEAGA